MKPTKIMLGTPYYGMTPFVWTRHVTNLVVNDIVKAGHEFMGHDGMASMATDHNRNRIAADFLKSPAEWLLWVDFDNPIPVGGLTRLLELDKPFCSGIYYGKHPPHPPIAYYRLHDHVGYVDIGNPAVPKWERGAILPVDAVGMGCCLMHRQVLEDIQKEHLVFQREYGALFVAHKNNIIGRPPAAGTHAKNDGKVVDGVLRERILPLALKDTPFPFFAIERGRTEDMWFCELADESGYKPILDTSIECTHFVVDEVSGEDYRNQREADGRGR